MFLPAAVTAWLDSDARRAAAHSSDLFTLEPADRWFLENGLFVVARDSQGCVWFAVDIDAEDPPVMLVDPDGYDDLTRYAESFAEWTRVVLWDGELMRDGGASWQFDHRVPADALTVLGQMLEALPRTYGWAANQPCDVMHRFDGELPDVGRARVIIAAKGDLAVWSLVAAPNPDVSKSIGRIIGVT